MTDDLRPIERRVLAMREAGQENGEIATRINRTPAHVERILQWTEIPRQGRPQSRAPQAMEKRVLALRAAGESHEQIADRFKRSRRSIRQVEGLAHFRMAMDLLGREQSA